MEMIMKIVKLFVGVVLASIVFFNLNVYAESLKEQNERMLNSVNQNLVTKDVYIKLENLPKSEFGRPISRIFFHLVNAFNPEQDWKTFCDALTVEKTLALREEFFRKNTRKLFEADCRKTTLNAVKTDIDQGRPLLAICNFDDAENLELSEAVAARSKIENLQELKKFVDSVKISTTKQSIRKNISNLLLGYNLETKEYLIFNFKNTSPFWIKEKYLKSYMVELYSFKSIKKDK